MDRAISQPESNFKLQATARDVGDSETVRNFAVAFYIECGARHSKSQF